MNLKKITNDLFNARKITKKQILQFVQAVVKELKRLDADADIKDDTLDMGYEIHVGDLYEPFWISYTGGELIWGDRDKKINTKSGSVKDTVQAILDFYEKID